MELKDIKTGDTVLVNHDNFLSRTIRKVMKKWGKKNGYDTSLLFSHAGRCIWISKKLYVFESVANGYQPRLFENHYDLQKTDLAIMRRKTPLKKDEMDQTTHFCLHLDTLSISYQFWNFAQWLLLVYLGINTFSKRKDDNDKFEYCYESEREARKNLNPDRYGNVDQTDIFQLLYDPNYEIIYKSR
jgi:hypothetical protein